MCSRHPKRPQREWSLLAPVDLRWRHPNATDKEHEFQLPVADGPVVMVFATGNGGLFERPCSLPAVLLKKRSGFAAVGLPAATLYSKGEYVGAYDQFLLTKSQLDGAYGFDPVWMPDFLIDFQSAMGVAESTVSRMNGETLDAFASLLAHCGLNAVPLEAVCVSRERAEAMGVLLNAALRKTENPAQLLWDDEQ